MTRTTAAWVAAVMLRAALLTEPRRPHWLLPPTVGPLVPPGLAAAPSGA